MSETVYISAHDRGVARELAAALRAAGHTVCSGWHDDPLPATPAADLAAWAARAAGNFWRIAGASALVLVGADEPVTGGKFVEAGVAVGRGVRVICLGRRENRMCAAFDLAPDVPALLGLLGGAA